MNTSFCKARPLAAIGVSLFVGTLALGNPPLARTGQTSWTALGVLASGVGDEGAPTYVGSNKCKKCHLTNHKSWAKTKMGKALETLKPGNATEAKTKHGLEPDKDYTKDESCLKCHTTGFGSDGGYVIPDETDKKAVRRAKKLAGVGCESCHGPGSRYIKVFEDIFKSKRRLERLGRWHCGHRGSQRTRMRQTSVLMVVNESS